VFVGLIGVALLTTWILGQDDGTRAQTGGDAPHFTVELIGGGSFDLSQHLEDDGRPLVLNLWASWCLPCRAEIPEIDAFASEHPEVRVLGVSVEDTEAGAVEFAEELSPGYPLALGNPDFEASYPRIGLPVTYVIGADGRVREVFNGILDRETLESLVIG
jgi:thiol-disulfide isomerase/thioredoxin